MDNELKMPSSKYLETKKNQAKVKITKVFDEYKEILRDRTHPDNQTQAYNQRIIKTLQRLLTAADELDGVCPGEGIFGLIVLNLRTNLKLKDENVKLEKRMKDLEIKIKRLEKR